MGRLTQSTEEIQSILDSVQDKADKADVVQPDWDATRGKAAVKNRPFGFNNPIRLSDADEIIDEVIDPDYDTHKITYKFLNWQFEGGLLMYVKGLLYDYNYEYEDYYYNRLYSGDYFRVRDFGDSAIIEVVFDGYNNDDNNYETIITITRDDMYDDVRAAIEEDVILAVDEVALRTSLPDIFIPDSIARQESVLDLYEEASLLWDETSSLWEETVSLNGEVSEIKGRVEELENGGGGSTSSNPTINITHAELLSLMRGGNLIPGQTYRITDYVTTTVQENTQSAGHQFDVIVTALDSATLSEKASAVAKESDEYFAPDRVNLAAWEIWYCIENDSTRFAWADTENGKGVIYRMIDEFGNDCPYDFKNILFKRSLNFDNGYAQYSEDGVETWVYTFAGQSLHVGNEVWSDMLDGSLESPFGHMSDENTSTFHNNVIKPYIKILDKEEVRSNAGRRYLNDNVFLGYWEEIGSIGEEDAPYYYSYCCNNNKLEEHCHANSFGINCCANTLERGCRGNVLSERCFSNVFGTYCTYNFFGSGCYNNILGKQSNSNTLGDECRYNVWGGLCSGNILGNDCFQNTFGSESSKNNLGALCYCNTFGLGCYGNRFEDHQGAASDVCYNKIDDDVCNVRFWVDDSPGEYRLVRYHHIYRGVNNREVELYTERTCETCVAIDSNGNLVEFVLADLKNS